MPVGCYSPIATGRTNPVIGIAIGSRCATTAGLRRDQEHVAPPADGGREDKIVGCVASGQRECGDSAGAIQQRENAKTGVGLGIGQAGNGRGDLDDVAKLKTADRCRNAIGQAGAGVGADGQTGGGIGKGQSIGGGHRAVQRDRAISADPHGSGSRQIAGQRQIATGRGQDAVIDDRGGDGGAGGGGNRSASLYGQGSRGGRAGADIDGTAGIDIERWRSGGGIAAGRGLDGKAARGHRTAIGDTETEASQGGWGSQTQGQLLLHTQPGPGAADADGTDDFRQGAGDRQGTADGNRSLGQRHRPDTGELGAVGQAEIGCGAGIVARLGSAADRALRADADRAGTAQGRPGAQLQAAVGQSEAAGGQAVGDGEGTGGIDVTDGGGAAADGGPCSHRHGTGAIRAAERHIARHGQAGEGSAAADHLIGQPGRSGDAHLRQAAGHGPRRVAAQHCVPPVAGQPPLPARRACPQERICIGRQDRHEIILTKIGSPAFGIADTARFCRKMRSVSLRDDQR